MLSLLVEKVKNTGTWQEDKMMLMTEVNNVNNVRTFHHPFLGWTHSLRGADRAPHASLSPAEAYAAALDSLHEFGVLHDGTGPSSPHL